MEMIQNQNIDVLFLFYKNMPVWVIKILLIHHSTPTC